MTTDEINPYGKLVAQKRTDEINPYGKLVAQERTAKTKDLFHFRFWLYAPAVFCRLHWLSSAQGDDGDVMAIFGNNVETGEDADYVGSSVDVRGRRNQHDRVIQRNAVAWLSRKPCQSTTECFGEGLGTPFPVVDDVRGQSASDMVILW
ncbi:hypothetical protein HRR83_008293 [Exophiala dermatitidis]|uniref:Uncharacterized protein n=1 Tax=Exophiala dermatitidis TaxID=5970 RepID=A0AAN6EM57_EXODE|nr:hypothetical protein HRR75_007361 [Exophiala dermatitidis]KAJ4507096.1 hypothetical protein HRR73_007918 [Exophiala dermatitidis]KAJ4507691.1 hypothetical protein HRR74_008019 [Exophiala dermatitidis]KAJ4533006.1 hypothetical protein HRR76_007976 [Exophiala dermatitidis]KAJ4535263.1 hypothetical protein HRR77_008174 [Exophiala dermatitidis]